MALSNLLIVLAVVSVQQQVENGYHSLLVCGLSVIPVTITHVPHHLHDWVVGITHWEATCKLPRRLVWVVNCLSL